MFKNKRLEILFFLIIGLIFVGVSVIEKYNYEKRIEHYQDLNAKIDSINTARYTYATVGLEFKNEKYLCKFDFKVFKSFIANKENLNTSSFLISGEMEIKKDKKTSKESLSWISINKINNEDNKKNETFGNCTLN